MAIRLLCLLLVSSCVGSDLDVAYAVSLGSNSLRGDIPGTDATDRGADIPSSLDFTFADRQLPPPLTVSYGDVGASWFLDVVRIDSKGRIIAGFIRRPATQDSPAVDVLLRLNPDGTLDRETAVPFVQAHRIPRRFEPMPDGKLLLFGRHISPTGSLRPGLMSLNEDLTIDNSFAPPLSPTEVVRALRVLPDGKFIIATEGSSPGNFIRRFHSNGSLDPTFNFQGPLFMSASALSLQSDGRLLVQYFSSIVRVDTTERLTPRSAFKPRPETPSNRKWQLV